MPRRVRPVQPRQDPVGQAGLVPAVAGQDDVDVRRLLVEDVAADDRDAAAVGPGVELDRRDREGVDVRAGRRRMRPACMAAIAHSPEPDAEVEDAPAGHDLRVLAQVAADREAAGPRERPVRQGGVRVAGLDLDGMPQRQHLVGEVEADLLEARDRPQPWCGEATNERCDLAIARLYVTWHGGHGAFEPGRMQARDARGGSGCHHGADGDPVPRRRRRPSPARSTCSITERARVLIDCGMFQGSPNESIRNRIPFAFDPAALDAVLLTHAHLDHCGLLPLLVKDGYRGPIHATPATIELATLVLLDSGRLHEEFAKREARWENRHPDKVEADDRKRGGRLPRRPGAGRRGRDRARPDDGRARRPGARHRGRRRRRARVAPRAPRPSDGRATRRPTCARSRPHLQIDLDAAALHGAGTPNARAPSSGPCATARRSRSRRASTPPTSTPATSSARRSSGCASCERDGGEERVIVCSGDLGRPGTPILRDPTAETGADYVLVESTYGGREHEPEQEAIRVLAETVRLVAESNGVLLVPSFAIGRTQEVVWELDRLIERGEIPLLPLYLDSPMASKASDIYRRHPDDLRRGDGEAAARGRQPARLPEPDRDQRRRARRRRSPGRPGRT